jgi:dimethylglycine dehydrogenase
MRNHVRVAVIGGGVVGASVLYHLTKAGWKDVLLIERAELTSGSSWHAAGGMHTLNGDPNVARLQQYTIDLYKEIEAISGISCGVHVSGGLLLAGTPERVDWLRMAVARGRYLGMYLELISAAEAKKLHPLLEEQHFLGAIHDPVEGHVDPYGVTHAYAKSAQIGGAEIVRQNRVVDTKQRPDGTWDVVTEKGTVHAEHVVNAGGLWAREVGRFVGLELPILAMEHQYFITEDLPELKGQPELKHVIDFEAEIYMRQERQGLLLGSYERAGVPWSPETTPWDFGQDLLPNDLERIAPSVALAAEHFPALERAGVRRIVNGPFTFAPDGNPLVGPVRGLRNYWVACGVMAGFCQGGGVGLSLANWIVEGDPGADIWAMDVARYGEWANRPYTNAKVRENYSRRFRIRFPNEELEAARGLRTTPIYDKLRDENAVFGDYCTLEHALWFAPKGTPAVEHATFRRSNAHAHVGEECRAVRESCGLIEISNYGKFEVTGPGAAEWLARLMTCRVPDIGRIALAPMLNERGRLIGDFTLCRLAEDDFFVVGTYAAEVFYRRWFERQAPPAGVSVRPCAMEVLGLSVAGPKSRDVLQPLVGQDLSTAAFPFLSFARINVGMIPALVGRISFTGELGYELWVAPEYLRALYHLLHEAGRAHGLRNFGGRALNALRLEKGFGNWSREFRPIYGPYEAGLGRFVHLDKPDFIGKAAAAAERAGGGVRKLVTLVVDAGDADAMGDEPVWHGDAVVGWVTSGGYGHTVGQSIALGYVENSVAGETTGFAVELIGERRPAVRSAGALVDPQGLRMRA